MNVSTYFNENMFSTNLKVMLGFMVFNTTFSNISVISWRRKPEYPEKTTDLSQVTDMNLKRNCLCGVMVKHAHLEYGRSWVQSMVWSK